jgi:hypothetical protein
MKNYMGVTYSNNWRQGPADIYEHLPHPKIEG